jgi:transposase
MILPRLPLYCYAIGESSSRRIEQATYDNVAVRDLAADQHPDHDIIASFRSLTGPILRTDILSVTALNSDGLAG